VCPGRPRARHRGTPVGALPQARRPCRLHSPKASAFQAGTAQAVTEYPGPAARPRTGGRRVRPPLACSCLMASTEISSAATAPVLEPVDRVPVLDQPLNRGQQIHREILHLRRHLFIARATSNSPQPNSGDYLICARPGRRTQLGPCPTRNSPSGLPTSMSQRQVNSTAVNPLMTHRPDSRHGASGAGIAGRRGSSDGCFSPRLRPAALIAARRTSRRVP
jgi:hypothetical protein